MNIPCPHPQTQNNFTPISNPIMNGLPPYTNQVENYITSNVSSMTLASVTPSSSLHSNSGLQNHFLGSFGMPGCNGQGYSPDLGIPTNPMEAAFLMRQSQNHHQQHQQQQQQRPQMSISAINYPVNNIHCNSFSTVAGLEPNMNKFGGYEVQFEHRPTANVQYSSQHEPIVLEKDAEKPLLQRYSLKDYTRFQQDKNNDSDQQYDIKNSWHVNKATLQSANEPVILEKDVDRTVSRRSLPRDYTRAAQTVDMHSSSRSIDVDNVFEMKNNWQFSNRDLKSKMNMSGMSLDEEADLLRARLNNSLRINNGSSHTKSNNHLPPLSKPPGDVVGAVLTVDKNMSSVLQMSVNTLGDSLIDFNDSTFKMTDSQAQLSIADVFEETDRELVSSRY